MALTTTKTDPGASPEAERPKKPQVRPRPVPELLLVVGLFLVYNTVTISVIARREEIGMLRAIGTTRFQLRQTILYESVITAIIGGILGIVIGIVLAWVVSLGFRSSGIVFAIPYGQVIVSLIVAAIAGAVAAAFPARRAARLNVLDALQYE